MKIEYLYPASWLCLIITALVAVVLLLTHKPKKALPIFTVGVYFALIFLFLFKNQVATQNYDAYTFLSAAYDAFNVFKLGYHFERLTGFAQEVMGADYRAYAAFLFVLAPVLTVSNVLSFFQATIDKLRYMSFPGTKYILSELNAESVALAESIRKEHFHAQIIFTGVGNPERKYDTKLLERARELGALCLKKDVTRLHYKVSLATNRIYLISSHESENVSDALVLIEKYKDSICKMDIYVFASSPDSKMAIDRADKGTHSLHLKFKSDLKKQLSKILQSSAMRNWKGFAEALEEVHLEGRFTIRCVDVAELTVRDVLNEHYKTIHDRAKNNGRVIGITILGFGKHGAALLKNAAWIFQFFHYKLQFNIFDIDGSARKYLQQETPMLRFDYGKVFEDDASHDILFMGKDHGIDCLTSDFDDLVLKSYWHRLKATQLVFVSLGDDSKNIAAAIHMRQLFSRKFIETEREKAGHGKTKEEESEILEKFKCTMSNVDSISSPLIFAVVNDSGRAKNLVNPAKDDNRSDKKGSENETAVEDRNDYHISPVATMLGTYDIKKLQGLRELEKSALKNHLAWSFRVVLDSNTGKLDDHTLQKLVNSTKQYVQYSYYRDSSVATSLHQQLLKKVEKELAEMAVNEGKDLAEIKKITEKMRWNAYMRSLGYQPFDIRDDRVKFHTLIKPYSEVSDEEKEKDLIEF